MDIDLKNQIVATQECAAGNGVVGTMWLETKIFHPDTTLQMVVDWVNNDLSDHNLGKLIITVSK